MHAEVDKVAGPDGLALAGMAEFLASPVANVIIGLAMAAALVAVGVYVISKVRGSLRRSEPATSQWLTKFQELHAKGELSDEEYRTIKAMLAERFQQELNGTDEPG